MSVVNCTQTGAICAHTESYIGQVLYTFERNGHDDSDFMALVFTDKPAVIQYGTTRFWTYHNSAKVDATAAVQTEAREYYYNSIVETEIRYDTMKQLFPVKGDTVKSLTSRGKNAGIVGTVMWIGEDGFKSTRHVTYHRVGIKVEGEDKLRYLPIERVERTEPRPVDTDAIKARARSFADNANWQSLMNSGSQHIFDPMIRYWYKEEK